MEDSVQTPRAQPPLIAHIIYRLSVGGLENGLVNLINHMPPEHYRHAIICLTDSTDFRDRIRRDDVPVISLHKRPGQDLGVHRRLWRLLRTLRPALVHTRNFSSLEYAVTAAFSGVPARVHGEHGRDVTDLDGLNWKYNIVRKAVSPVVNGYIAVSEDLARWLVSTVGVDADRVAQIYNGVDIHRFHPRTEPRAALGPENFAPPGTFVIGTVGRMQEVKDQLTLVRAFLRLLEREPNGSDVLRLAVIGEGPLREEAKRLLRLANSEHLAWLPGERADIPELMREFDLFVLPSLREGISNTILEAMASGLPVVATRVGGNPELVEEGETGMLVPPAGPDDMAAAIRRYAGDAGMVKSHGLAGRRRADTRFSMDAMVNGYLTVYDTVLNCGAKERSHLRRGALQSQV